MSNFELDKSPLYESFKDLQYGETVYSKKYGLGQVCGFFGEEIIIKFSNLRKRFSLEDKEIRRILDNYFKKVSKGVKVSYEGKAMSYVEYKKTVGLTRKQIKEEKLKHITLKEALEILGIGRTALDNAITVNNIKTRTFGRNIMIHRDDLLRLHKNLKKDKLR